MVEISYFRSSSYKNWDLCQHQYFLSYVLGLPQKTHPSAEKGTIFHKVMECLANCKKCQQDGTTGFIDDSLGQISAEDMFNDKFVNSIINRSFDYYSRKSQNCFEEKDFKDIEKWVGKTLRFRDGLFDPRKREIVGAEVHFDFEIDCDWAILPDGSRLRMRGTIDLITKINDRTYESIDWKTGKLRDWDKGKDKDFNSFYEDAQLRIYHYAMSIIYPDIQYFIPTIYYAQTDNPFSMPFERKDIDKVKELLHNQYKEITECTTPELKDGGEHFFCKRVCDYKKQIWSPQSKCDLCQEVHRSLLKYGIDFVTKKYTAKGHSVDTYQSPGS